MPSAIGTILEFEVRQLRNELRTVARSRLRVTMWIVSSLCFVVFVGGRFFAAHALHRDATHVAGSSAAIFAGVYVGYIALALIATLSIGAQFASTAEALFVGTSTLRPQTIFIWLQLRALRHAIVRTFVVLVILATNGSANAAETARLTLLGFACILIPPAFAFHLNALAPRPRFALRIVGCALLAYAIAIGFELLPGGSALMRSVAHGAWLPTACALVVAAVGVAFSPIRDPVPELLAATRAGGLRAKRIAERRSQAKRDGGKTSDWLFDLSGEWVILSGKLATFFRGRPPIWFGLGLFGWFVGGLAAGAAGLFYQNASEIIFASAIPFVFIVCLFAASVGRDLGADIRNPLWWAGDAGMMSRLSVDAIASVWRLVVSAAVVLAGYGVFDHAAYAAIVFVLFVGLVWLARACGYLLFAYFPAAIDQRGALAGLRIIILFALGIPVAIIAGVVTLLQLAPAVQVGCIVAMALVQAAGLLRFAARRMDGRLEAYLAA